MNPKYQVGQLVKFVNDTVAEAGKIVSYSYHSLEDKILYQIEAKEVDIPNKKIITGVKHLWEDEVEPVEEPKPSEDQNQTEPSQGSQQQEQSEQSTGQGGQNV